MENKIQQNGCSTCQPGQEKWDFFHNPFLKKNLVEYEYRTDAGRLFTGIFPTLEKAREVRASWEKRISTSRIFKNGEVIIDPDKKTIAIPASWADTIQEATDIVKKELGSQDIRVRVDTLPNNRQIWVFTWGEGE